MRVLHSVQLEVSLFCVQSARLWIFHERFYDEFPILGCTYIQYKVVQQCLKEMLVTQSQKISIRMKLPLK